MGFAAELAFEGVEGGLGVLGDVVVFGFFEVGGAVFVVVLEGEEVGC